MRTLRTGHRFPLALALAALGAAGALAMPAAMADRVAERSAAASTVPAELKLDRTALAITPVPGAENLVRVRYPGSQPGPAGSPDVPRMLVWIEVPAGLHATGVAAQP